MNKATDATAAPADPSGGSPQRMKPGAEPPIDPAAEETHWRSQFGREPYYQSGRRYEDYHVAYELGWSRRAQSDAHFDEHETELAREWEVRRGASPLGWPEARSAARAAWDRADQMVYEQAKAVGKAEAFAFIEPQGNSEAGSANSAPAAMSDEEVIAQLNDLLENARDGEQGYRACAEQVNAAGLRKLLDRQASHYHELGQQLAPLITQYGGTPADGGTVRGALQRGWVHLKSLLGGDSAESILKECERAEDASVDRYRRALQRNLPSDVRMLVDQQSADVREGQETIRELRHEAGRS